MGILTSSFKSWENSLFSGDLFQQPTFRSTLMHIKKSGARPTLLGTFCRGEPQILKLILKNNCDKYVCCLGFTFISDDLVSSISSIYLIYKSRAFSGKFLERVLRLLQIIHHFVKSFQQPPPLRPTFLLLPNVHMKFKKYKILT